MWTSEPLYSFHTTRVVAIASSRLLEQAVVQGTTRSFMKGKFSNLNHLKQKKNKKKILKEKRKEWRMTNFKVENGY